MENNLNSFRKSESWRIRIFSDTQPVTACECGCLQISFRVPDDEGAHGFNRLVRHGPAQQRCPGLPTLTLIGKRVRAEVDFCDRNSSPPKNAQQSTISID